MKIYFRLFIATLSLTLLSFQLPSLAKAIEHSLALRQKIAQEATLAIKSLSKDQVPSISEKCQLRTPKLRGEFPKNINGYTTLSLCSGGKTLGTLALEVDFIVNSVLLNITALDIVDSPYKHEILKALIGQALLDFPMTFRIAISPEKKHILGLNLKGEESQSVRERIMASDLYPALAELGLINLVVQDPKNPLSGHFMDVDTEKFKANANDPNVLPSEPLEQFANIVKSNQMSFYRSLPYSFLALQSQDRIPKQSDPKLAEFVGKTDSLCALVALTTVISAAKYSLNQGYLGNFTDSEKSGFDIIATLLEFTKTDPELIQQKVQEDGIDLPGLYKLTDFLIQKESLGHLLQFELIHEQAPRTELLDGSAIAISDFMRIESFTLSGALEHAISLLGYSEDYSDNDYRIYASDPLDEDLTWIRIKRDTLNPVEYWHQSSSSIRGHIKGFVSIKLKE